MDNTGLSLGDILEIFHRCYPDIEVDSTRPLSDLYIGDRKGCTIFLKNGDIIQYFPREILQLGCMSDYCTKQWLGHTLEILEDPECPYTYKEEMEQACRNALRMMEIKEFEEQYKQRQEEAKKNGKL